MRFSLFRSALVGLCLTIFPLILHANNFYPPLPSAKPFIDFDKRGFLINGQRTWISSAGIEYARVPRQLWRDRLLKIKRAGFNCVEIYAFWNDHETAPGQWDFTGDKDVGAFLDLVRQLGLYATVRVGPYVCAEWENGGFPMWLRFTPGLRVRQDEPHYLADVDGWYNHILPIVAAHQISKGGSVIMVQLENEDDEGWGAWDLDPVKQAYFKHLLDSARAHGIDVLTFFSGMNHGGDPAPRQPIDTDKQPNPWYTTEYWCNWYSQYGAMNPGDLTHFDRATWRFLQNGAQGFNVYMFHGGSNFGTWNNNETAASYDYGAAIGQAGDLRPIYYKFKRVACFARSFQDILENANIAPTAPADNFPGLTTTTRTGPAGSITFLDNPGDKPVDAKFPDGNTMTLAPGEITGLVRNFALDGNMKLDSAEARILGLEHEGDSAMLVVYGPAGSTGQLTLSGVDNDFTGSAILAKGEMPPIPHWTPAQNGKSSIQVRFPASGASQFTFTDNGKTLRVIAMSGELADNSYFIDASAGHCLVSGAPYVADFTPSPEGSPPAMELPLDATATPAVAVYAVNAKVASPMEIMATITHDADTKSAHDEQFDPASLPPLNPTAPTLTNWTSAPANAEAAPGYDDSGWKKSGDPLPMGADGDNSAYAWYRAKIHADAAGTQYLQVPFIGDQAIAFLNGARIPGTFGGMGQNIPLDLKSGENTLALLVSHNGRNKLIGTYGSVEHLDSKGLVGPIRLLPAAVPVVPLGDFLAHDWWSNPPPPDALADPRLDTSDNAKYGPGNWSPGNFRANFGNQAPCTWRSPFVCLRATLPDIAGPHRVLHVGYFDEKATFYLNGQEICTAFNNLWPAPSTEDHSIIRPFNLPLDSAWKDGGPNQFTIILQNSHAQATIGIVYLTNGASDKIAVGSEGPMIVAYNSENVIGNWRMRGGLTVSHLFAAKTDEPTDTGPLVFTWKPAAPGYPSEPPSSPQDWKSLALAQVIKDGTPAATAATNQPVSGSTAPPGIPTWYRATFTLPADWNKDAVPVLRFSTKGLSRGFVWLNGHNLGRYPEKVNVDGPYLPEPWLQPGENELLVLDEEGHAITPTHLYIETAASRRIVSR